MIDSLCHMDFCDVLRREGNVQVVLCHPDAGSGELEMQSGGLTSNDQGELVSVGRVEFRAREFGVIEPIFQFSGDGELSKFSFEWEIDSGFSLSVPEWKPFGFKYFQDGGCGIVELDAVEPRSEEIKLIAVFPCEWGAYLQGFLEFIEEDSELFCSSVVSSNDEGRLRELATGNSNPLLSFFAFRRLIELGRFDDDHVVLELNESKGLKLSLVVYLLLEEMGADAVSSVVGNYLEQSNSDVEAVAYAAFAKFAQDSKNREFNRFIRLNRLGRLDRLNRSLDRLSDDPTSRNSIFQSKQEYLDRQGSYRILLKIQSLNYQNEKINEIIKRGYF